MDIRFIIVIPHSLHHQHSLLFHLQPLLHLLVDLTYTPGCRHSSTHPVPLSSHQTPSPPPPLTEPQNVDRRLRRSVIPGPQLNASPADPAEFGNYIGGDLESDDESDYDVAPSATAPAPSAPGPSQPSAAYAPLEGLEEEDEAMEDEEPGLEMTLHGVDG